MPEALQGAQVGGVARRLDFGERLPGGLGEVAGEPERLGLVVAGEFTEDVEVDGCVGHVEGRFGWSLLRSARRLPRNSHPNPKIIMINAKSSAVILVGFQNDYFAKNGILRGVVEEPNSSCSFTASTGAPPA